MISARTTIIQQALFGYAAGHRLIASSVALDSTTEAALARLTDDTGAAGISGFDGYLSGYPLPSGQYAVTRTWRAPEAPRPGAVWTHALLLDARELNYVGWDFDAVFRRPDGRDVTPYTAQVSLHVKPGRSTVDGNAAAWAPLLSNLFSNRDRSAWLTLATSQAAEPVVLQLWWWLWPALRRKFAFCLGAAGPRRGPGGEFDLLIVPSRLARTAALDLGAEATVADAVGSAVAADLFASEATPLGEFVRFVGAETDDPAAVRRLVTLWKDATTVTAQSAEARFRRTAEEIAARYPRQTEMRRLKRLVIMPDAKFPATWSPLQVCAVLATGRLASSTAGADVHARDLVEAVLDKPQLLAQLAGIDRAPRGSLAASLRTQARAALAVRGQPDWLHVLVGQDPELAVEALARARPDERAEWARAFWGLDRTAVDALTSSLTSALAWVAAYDVDRGLLLLEKLSDAAGGESSITIFLDELESNSDLLPRWVEQMSDPVAAHVIGSVSDDDCHRLVTVLAIVEPTTASMRSTRLSHWRLASLDSDRIGGPAGAHLLRLLPKRRPSKTDIGVIGGALAVAWQALAASDELTWRSLNGLPASLGPDNDWDRARRLSRAIALVLLSWDDESGSRPASQIAIAAARRVNAAAADQLLQELDAVRQTHYTSKARGKKKKKKSLVGQAWELTQELFPWH